jgi:DNA-binding beta-propeller fold protein YncE
VTAKLNRPRAVAVTPDGNQLFIADAVNDRVRVLNLDNGRLTRFAGDGEEDLDPEGQDAAQTTLDAPAGLAIYDDGTLFISDTGHALVYRTRLRF